MAPTELYLIAVDKIKKLQKDFYSVYLWEGSPQFILELKKL
jgi:hypothetical protein